MATDDTPDPGASDPTGWFEPLYAAAARGEAGIPWDRHAPHPLLVRWADQRHPAGTGKRAVVVGCGTGDDAALIAGLGYETIAFDIAPSAVEAARIRHPNAGVDFQTADLFALPDDWLRGFELVVEIQTVQALPRSLRKTAISQVSRLAAPGASIVVIAAASDRPTPEGPPWPLTRAELAGFEETGGSIVTIDRIPGEDTGPFSSRWLAEFIAAPGAKRG